MVTRKTKGDGNIPAARAASSATSAVGLYGMVGVFDPEMEEWSEYTEKLVHYFHANDIVADDKRRAILLTFVGPTVYHLLRTLASLRKLDEFKFNELVDLAMSH